MKPYRFSTFLLPFQRLFCQAIFPRLLYLCHLIVIVCTDVDVRLKDFCDVLTMLSRYHLQSVILIPTGFYCDDKLSRFVTISASNIHVSLFTFYSFFLFQKFLSFFLFIFADKLFLFCFLPMFRFLFSLISWSISAFYQ